MELVSSYKRLEGMLHSLPENEEPPDKAAVDPESGPTRRHCICPCFPRTSQALELRADLPCL